jgi:hypothetical protein
MTRFPASGGGSGPPYTYVMDGFPEGAEEGESLYHITEDAAYVYTGSTWVEQTVTNHSQLAGVSAGDHHDRYTDAEAESAAPVDSVNGQIGAVSIRPGPTVVESGTQSFDNGYPRNEAQLTKTWSDNATQIEVRLGFTDSDTVGPTFFKYNVGDGPFVISWSITELVGSGDDEIGEIKYKVLKH